MDFWKLLSSVSLPGLWYNLGDWLHDIFDKDYNNSLIGGFINSVGNFFGNKDEQNNLVSSLAGNYLHTGLTGQQIAENEYTAQREDTRYSRSVADMQTAGLNPALMFGSASTPSVNSSAPANSGSLSDLIQLAMLPIQMRAVNAQIKNTEAQTRNTDANTENTQVDTDYKRLLNEWYPSMTQSQIDRNLADIDKAYSDIDVNQSNVQLIRNKADVESITAKYLPSKLQSEIDNIKANIFKVDADTRLSLVKTAFEQLQLNYAEQNNFLMSSSDTLLTLTYILDVLGLEKNDITIPGIISNTKNMISKHKAKIGIGGRSFEKAGTPAPGSASAGGSR